MSLCDLAGRSTQLTTTGFAGSTMRFFDRVHHGCHTLKCEFQKHETKPAHACFFVLSARSRWEDHPT